MNSTIPQYNLAIKFKNKMYLLLNKKNVVQIAKIFNKLYYLIFFFLLNILEINILDSFTLGISIDYIVLNFICG